jgi:DNA-binding winged helix-turn-helix (wHTH) protein/TolB-like protein/Tfp pilus assembly protein PilF
MGSIPTADNANPTSNRSPLGSQKKVLRNYYASIPTEIRYLYDFGAFHLDPHQRLLLCNGKTAAITPKAFELLVVLVERSGKLVEKSELLRIVWPDVSVEEGNLAVLISQLRKVLGDDRGKHEYIETVSKYGYRFVAPVSQQIAVEEEIAPVPEETKAQISAPPLSPEPASQPPIKLRSSPASRLAIGSLLAILAIGALYLVGRSILLQARERRALSDTASMHSLAVLPFRVMGARNGDEYLGEGTADALVTKLGSIDSIVERPISAVEKYRNSSLTVKEIGKDQGVDAVLDGRIQREADRVRLTVQLIRVRDGVEVWADSFDEKLTSTFELENEISDRVFQALSLRLTNTNPRRTNKKPTENAAAYDSYVKGRYFWNKRTSEGLQKGLEYFREAIGLDPSFAEAYEGVADSYAALGLYAVLPPEDAFPAARDAAQKALQMDDNLSDAHATLGMIHFYYDWDGPAAENEFRRSLDINPNYAMAHSWYAETLAAMGRFPEALEEVKRALSDDPLSQIVNSNAGWTLCVAGQNEAAIQTLKKAIEMDPNFPRSHFRLGLAYETKGLFGQALPEFQKAIQLSGGNPYYQASLGNAYGASGHVTEVHQLLKELKARTVHEPVPAFAFAIVYLGLNDKDAAFQWLEKTPADHSTSMAFAKVDPMLANVRSDPRFAVLAKRLNF